MRDEGYYWVSLQGSCEVGFWSNDRWWLTGNDEGFTDESVSVQGERLVPGVATSELSPEARSILECEGEWNEAGGLELVHAGMAVPSQIELTREGQKAAAALRGDGEGSTPDA